MDDTKKTTLVDNGYEIPPKSIIEQIPPETLYGIPPNFQGAVVFVPHEHTEPNPLAEKTLTEQFGLDAKPD